MATNKKDCPWPIPPLVDTELDREWLGWLEDLKKKDWDAVLKQTRKGQDPSVRMIYENCGMGVLAWLWKYHMSTALYISEAPLNDLRKIYIRRFYDVDDPENCVKVLATRLSCSEQFVRESLDEDPKQDPRQLDAFKEKEKAS